MAEESVSESFDRLLRVYQDIESSSLPTNDPQLQTKITEAIAGLVRATVLVSELGIFSSNETLEDLPTSSIKLLLLPALLGTLTLKQTDKDRTETLRIAAVYLRDFLQRCFSYGVTKTRPPQHLGDSEEEEEEEEGRRNKGQDVKRNGPPTPEELQEMARQRQDKISRYRERTDMVARLDILKAMYRQRAEDEEVARKYHTTLVQKFALESVEELESVVMERKMLQQMASLKLKGGGEAASPPPPTAPPLKPILITRDAAQKNVFGLGYPSRPSLTVQEFYDQRVRDGWFPDPTKSRSCLQDRSTMTPEQEAAIREAEEAEEERKAEEEEDPEVLERARARDEWRDNHRRGWGNTYNRS
ncbi:immunoglobulin-binding protein 1-like [Eriocheir sinensis]|uniref:immunoglobulin-binding protein 1-like n=1 Tax=Eriocheir sinensis TaxID=95602 RepID=UPI0021CAA60B|nr:immunoglobulin-binding protein 1-like [Eriocheir sinensis]